MDKSCLMDYISDIVAAWTHVRESVEFMKLYQNVSAMISEMQGSQFKFIFWTSLM